MSFYKTIIGEILNTRKELNIDKSKILISFSNEGRACAMHEREAVWTFTTDINTGEQLSYLGYKFEIDPHQKELFKIKRGK